MSGAGGWVFGRHDKGGTLWGNDDLIYEVSTMPRSLGILAVAQEDPFSLAVLMSNISGKCTLPWRRIVPN